MSKLNARILVPVLLAVGWLAVMPAPAAAQQQSFRGEKWQFSIPINFTFSKEIEGEGGSSVDLNNDVGWGLGFGYHFNNRFMLGFEATWLSANYKASVVVDDEGDGDPDGTVDIGGSLDAASLQAVGQFNLLERNRFTPFVRGNLGMTYSDSNIPSGPPLGSCWWDPWWGYICGTWQPTYDRTSFSFGGAVGIRAELNRSFFLEGSAGLLWVSFSESTPSFGGIRLTAGWLF